MNADGSGVHQVTDVDDVDAPSAWSPDGSRIAFASDRDGDFEVFVMNADGTGEQQLTEDFSINLWPSWSPDGTRIAFNSYRDGHLETFVMNADGSNRQQLTQCSHNPSGVGWSPDGTQLVYGGDVGNLELFVMNADDTNQRQITSNTYPEYVTSQAWSSRTLETGSDVFKDVSTGHDTDRPIGWTFSNGVTPGVGEGAF